MRGRDSIVGAGTTFRLRLPAVVAKADRREEITARASAGRCGTGLPPAIVCRHGKTVGMKRQSQFF